MKESVKDGVKVVDEKSSTSKQKNSEIEVRAEESRKMTELIKEKVIIFIVGLLVGSLISTGSIFAYSKANNSFNHNNQNTQLRSRTQRQMPNGKFGNNGDANKHSKKSESSTSEENKTSESSNSDTKTSS